jgi:hypothetical protein
MKLRVGEKAGKGKTVTDTATESHNVYETPAPALNKIFQAAPAPASSRLQLRLLAKVFWK